MLGEERVDQPRGDRAPSARTDSSRAAFSRRRILLLAVQERVQPFELRASLIMVRPPDVPQPPTMPHRVDLGLRLAELGQQLERLPPPRPRRCGSWRSRRGPAPSRRRRTSTRMLLIDDAGDVHLAADAADVHERELAGRHR